MKVFKAIGRFFKKLGYSIAKFFVLTVREMKKVRWLEKKDLAKYSVATIFFILIFMAFFTASDTVLYKIVEMVSK